MAAYSLPDLFCIKLLPTKQALTVFSLLFGHSNTPALQTFLSLYDPQKPDMCGNAVHPVAVCTSPSLTSLHNHNIHNPTVNTA
jgi:hypothetical protein